MEQSGETFLKIYWLALISLFFIQTSLKCLYVTAQIPNLMICQNVCCHGVL